MDIIDRLNAVYTIKFTENYEILKRGNRNYFLLNTFDDKKYIFKSYIRNTNNTTKLKNANDVSHLVSKQIFLFSDYIVSKEYDPIVELDDNTIGTLFSYSDGQFLEPEQVTESHIKKLAELSNQFHKVGYELFEQSFSVNQIENISQVLARTIEKMREELDENGIHYMLENKFGLKMDLDMIYLNLSHTEKVIERLISTKPTILNMDANFENITFGKDESKDEVITNVVMDRVLVGNPCFEVAKTISRLSIFLNQQKTSDLKKIFLDSVEDKSLYPSEVLDTLIDFNSINMFYKFVKSETFREQNETFIKLKNKLIKSKFLIFA